jgi:hypothetical protein
VTGVQVPEQISFVELKPFTPLLVHKLIVEYVNGVVGVGVLVDVGVGLDPVVAVGL